MFPITNRTLRIVNRAGDRARTLGLDYIGAEHLLLGLLDENDGPAAAALATLDVDPAEAEARVLEIDAVHGRPAEDRSTEPTTGSLRFTTQARLVVDRAETESELLGFDYIGAEHLLLGLVRRPDSVPAQVLAALGADPERLRAAVRAAGPSTHADDQPRPRIPFG